MRAHTKHHTSLYCPHSNYGTKCSSISSFFSFLHRCFCSIVDCAKLQKKNRSFRLKGSALLLQPIILPGGCGVSFFFFAHSAEYLQFFFRMKEGRWNFKLLTIIIKQKSPRFKWPWKENHSFSTNESSKTENVCILTMSFMKWHLVANLVLFTWLFASRANQWIYLQTKQTTWISHTNHWPLNVRSHSGRYVQQSIFKRETQTNCQNQRIIFNWKPIK